MEGLSAERCLTLRAEASWRTSLKLPDEPPWVYVKAATTLSERPKQGIVRRPLIYPPPAHSRAAPPNIELAEQEPGASDFRRRLEERFKDEFSVRRDGYVVFDDAATYSMPSNQSSQQRTRVFSYQESTENPTLTFESRFECGNLRKAVQVGPREYDLVVSLPSFSAFAANHPVLISVAPLSVPPPRQGLWTCPVVLLVPPPPRSPFSLCTTRY